jgi:hypothetical protein
MEQTQRFPNLFTPLALVQLQARIDQLQPDSRPLWGKMNVSQMLAHCCIPFEQALHMQHDGPNMLMKIVLRLFFKKSMINEVPYRHNLPTAPSFIIDDERSFEAEQFRLKQLLQTFSSKGEAHFEGKKQITLGALSAKAWNNLMYKHLDHHLRQFGV